MMAIIINILTKNDGTTDITHAYKTQNTISRFYTAGSGTVPKTLPGSYLGGQGKIIKRGCRWKREGGVGHKSSRPTRCT